MLGAMMDGGDDRGFRGDDGWDSQSNRMYSFAGSLFPWLKDPDLETALRSALGPDACPIRRKREPRGQLPDEPFVFYDGRRWSAHYWRRHSLMDGPYADIPVYPRSPHMLASWAPSGDDNGGSVPFKDFVWMRQSTSIFDRSSRSGRTLVEHLLERDEWDVPEFLERRDAPMEQRGMAAGPSRTGFPFHSHGEAWQMQVIGKKLWLLHPPPSGGSPDLPPSWEIAQPMALLERTLLGGALGGDGAGGGAGGGSGGDGGDDGAPNAAPKPPPGLPAKMIACLLEPGEVIYVPRLWWHATLNVGESIGIGGERAAVDMSPSLLDGLMRGEATRRIYKVWSLHGQRLQQQQGGEGERNKAAALEARRRAHALRPTEPGGARELVESLLASQLVAEATEILDAFEAAVEAKRAERPSAWLSDAEASGLYAMVAAPLLTAPDQAWPGVATLPARALALNERAVALDASNWGARISAAHAAIALGGAANLERGMELLSAVPPVSQGGGPAARALGSMCASPGLPQPMRARFCASHGAKGEL